MKAKTIKTVIRKKINEWLETIEDENIKTLAAKNTIVTGGSIASMLLGEKINDFDLYFKNHATALAIAKYYVSRFNPQKKNGIPIRISVLDEYDDKQSEQRIKIVVKSAGIASENGTEKPYEYFESMPEGEAAGYVSEIITDPGDIEDTYQDIEEKALNTEDDGKPNYRPIFLSTNAITLSNKIQLVIRFYGEPDEIHKNYDYVHCTNYWTSWDNNLVLRQDALESLLARELKYNGSKYPVCSVFRIRKFIRRGWCINAGQILKMCMQISKLNLEDIEVLQDQLTGVDCAYFLEVIEKLKEKDPEKVNYAYLVEIIDRMF